MGGIAVIVRIQVVKNEIFIWKTPVNPTVCLFVRL